MTSTADPKLPFEPSDFTLDELPDQLAGVDDDDVVRQLAARDTRVTSPPLYEARVAEILADRGVVGIARVNPAAIAADVVVVGHGREVEVTARNRAALEEASVTRGEAEVPMYLIEEV